MSMTEKTTSPVPIPTTPESPLRLASAAYAGFWRRVGAFVVDLLVLGVIGQLVALLFSHQFMTLGQAGRLVGFAIAAIYFIPAHHRWGQTIGKRLMRIRVQALNGGPVSLSTATFRYVALYVPWLLNGVFFAAPDWPKMLTIAVGVVMGSVLVIGLLGNAYLLAFNKPSRRLIHDLIAGTVVVNAGSDRVALVAGDVRLAAVHWIVVGLIPVGVFGIFGWLALSSQMTLAHLAELQSAQADLNRLPGVLQARLVEQQPFDARRGAHVISAQLWVSDSNEASDPTLVRETVTVILRRDPSSRATDGVAVSITRGFDIGIASFWRRNSEFHSIPEWQRTLEDLGTPK
jgi:uncharacterized RDD family membrane protein YckC